MYLDRTWTIRQKGQRRNPIYLFRFLRLVNIISPIQLIVKDVTVQNLNCLMVHFQRLCTSVLDEVPKYLMADVILRCHPFASSESLS